MEKIKNQSQPISFSYPVASPLSVPFSLKMHISLVEFEYLIDSLPYLLFQRSSLFIGFAERSR